MHLHSHPPPGAQRVCELGSADSRHTLQMGRLRRSTVKGLPQDTKVTEPQQAASVLTGRSLSLWPLNKPLSAQHPETLLTRNQVLVLPAHDPLLPFTLPMNFQLHAGAHKVPMTNLLLASCHKPLFFFFPTSSPLHLLFP